MTLHLVVGRLFAPSDMLDGVGWADGELSDDAAFSAFVQPVVLEADLYRVEQRSDPAVGRTPSRLEG